LAADGQLEVLHEFGDSDGSGAYGLVLAPDGFFYGVTGTGGEFDAGTAFRVSPQGQFKLLHAFRRSADSGGWPRGNLLLASDGYFYGTTAVGGAADRGTVFRMKPNGQVKWLHAFDPAQKDGATPLGRLIEGSDGLIYGTTTAGGQYCCGTVFKMHRNGELHIVHSFSFDGHDGYSPDTGVTEGPDGRFYGVAEGHRENRRGLIFRFDRRGHFKVVYDFPPPSEINGREPRQALTRGRDGALYGTTSWGGAYEFGGTIFRFTTDGVLTTLHSFDNDSPVGRGAANALLERGDGEFIGTTYAGGEANRGSIYRLRVSP
ncbi:MAG TPA: choice-of-anchor tandem repeat GloVer-containing protein, partial [Ideonella sp.]|nr:choice-of-anchor tandem repeat GloVer-containing protein [Ideonella sp.]